MSGTNINTISITKRNIQHQLYKIKRYGLVFEHKMFRCYDIHIVNTEEVMIMGLTVEEIEKHINDKLKEEFISKAIDSIRYEGKKDLQDFIGSRYYKDLQEGLKRECFLSLSRSYNYRIKNDDQNWCVRVRERDFWDLGYRDVWHIELKENSLDVLVGKSLGTKEVLSIVREFLDNVVGEADLKVMEGKGFKVNIKHSK